MGSRKPIRTAGGPRARPIEHEHKRAWLTGPQDKPTECPSASQISTEEATRTTTSVTRSCARPIHRPPRSIKCESVGANRVAPTTASATVTTAPIQKTSTGFQRHRQTQAQAQRQQLQGQVEVQQPTRPVAALELQQQQITQIWAPGTSRIGPVAATSLASCGNNQKERARPKQEHEQQKKQWQQQQQRRTPLYHHDAAQREQNQNKTNRHQYSPELTRPPAAPTVATIAPYLNSNTSLVNSNTTATPYKGRDTAEQASSFASRRGISNISPLTGIQRIHAPSSSSLSTSSSASSCLSQTQDTSLAAHLNQLDCGLPVAHLYQQLTTDHQDQDECGESGRNEQDQRLLEFVSHPATFKRSIVTSKQVERSFIRQVQQLKRQLRDSGKREQHSEPSSPSTLTTSTSSKDIQKRKHLAMATVRPISPQYQHTLDSAISLAKELASKNMADSGESSPKTPNSPDKKRFNFKLKHFSKSYSDASANIRDIESSISDEAKLAYKSLVERGPFNSYNSRSSHSFGADRAHFGNFHNQHSPRALYENDDFSPTTPPSSAKSKYSNRGGSTFSMKKSFF